MAGCEAFGPPYDVTCDERIPEPECGAIADAGLGAIATVEADRGELMSVEVLLIEDCDRAARGMFQPALSDTSVTACWTVQSVWQRAQPSVVVARMASGELIAFP